MIRLLFLAVLWNVTLSLPISSRTDLVTEPASYWVKFSGQHNRERRWWREPMYREWQEFSLSIDSIEWDYFGSCSEVHESQQCLRWLSNEQLTLFLKVLMVQFSDAIRSCLCMSGELEDGECKNISLLNGIVCFRTCNLVECFVRWGVNEFWAWFFELCTVLYQCVFYILTITCTA